MRQPRPAGRGSAAGRGHPRNDRHRPGPPVVDQAGSRRDQDDVSPSPLFPPLADGSLHRRGAREVQHDPRGHLTMLQAVEDVVDRPERLQFDIGLHLAVGREGQRLGHLLAVAHERAADGDAVRHHVEERHRDVARRQPDQRAGAPLAGHRDPLLERVE